MEQLFTPETLAIYLGLSLQTIYNRHSTGGDLPVAIKMGRRLRFKPVDVENWLNQHQHIHSCPTVSSEKTRPGRPTKSEQIARRSARS
ncbi:helix-turn-helix domain-containing protein [uncultured Oxalicibacterium sp.]|uniref:helix-turn-helix transcriptional regulator n=1 Tax=uncultured Oxalicibacterium sp. TaxID=1168540 RepID=UPI0025D4BD52|nr:helix-turn-helix domain-containing protein [uncultured Oxalicibacterium sp.]